MNKSIPPMLRKLTAVSIALLPTLTATHLVMAQQPPINPFTGQPMPAVPSGGGTPVPGGFSMPGITIQAPQAGGAVAAPAASPAAQPTPPGTAAAPTMPAPLAMPAPGAVAATTPAGGNPGAVLSNTPNPGVTLKFDNADIYEVIQVVLGEVLKLDYVIDPTVQGRVTLKSTGAISMADIYSTLETALAASNISIVRQGKLYKVLRDTNAVRDAGLGPGVGAASSVMQIIPVQFVQANQLANTLRGFVGSQAAITNDPSNRYLIVVDKAANVEKIVEMVKTLDSDYVSQVQIKLFPLAHSEAADVAKELDAIFKTSGIFNKPGTDATKTFFLPVARMNAVMVAAANPALLQTAEQWIKTLDAEPRNGLGSFVHVYPVANGNAANLASLVTQIFGGSAPTQNNANTGAAGLSSATGTAFGSSGGATGTNTGLAGAASGTNNQNNSSAARTIERGNTPSQGTTGTAPGLGGSVQVIADTETNTLIVRASPQDYQQVRKVLERLDSSPRQVMVQVMVAEVTLTDALQYGVEWWIKSALTTGGKSWPGFLGLDGAIGPTGVNTSAVGSSTSTPIVGSTPRVTGTSTGLNYAVFGSAGQVIGLLNVLGRDTNVNILSAPHVLASDGKVAKIEVGSEVPVITQTVSTPSSGLLTNSFSTSNSVQYRPTGILLEVKPSITSTGRLTLSISQEVSSLGDQLDAGGAKYPSFLKRKVTTDATIEDGKTILLAGLIENRTENGVVGVPVLKDIPIVGGLFGTTSKTKTKTELLISITPYIINNREEADRLAGSFQESLHKLRGMLQDKDTTVPPNLGRDAPVQSQQKPAALRAPQIQNSEAFVN
ncbi:general secretion pathway protein D [Acidovorax sp. CF316]|uniref:type II secretion system secretin GspD n=1 Tax=Acidovorax sp. CF316 TaxID=1144317 RepID=UPI00026BC277|nr:type II secretion system secretin GspD [Acidovorax sp. CF316]EJE54387.1 general secretion pathway protein D [Acidovorax sp. CF316]